MIYSLQSGFADLTYRNGAPSNFCFSRPKEPPRVQILLLNCKDFFYNELARQADKKRVFASLFHPGIRPMIGTTEAGVSATV